MSLLALLGCSDPQLDPLRDALEAYDAGRRALDQGRPAEAAAAFAEARAHDPRTALLALWQAHALARAGDVAGAEAVAGEALGVDPSLHLARYQRAAYRARLGRLDASAADLGPALRAGVVAPLQAAADPDFQPHLGHAAFAGMLPPSPVLVDLAGPVGAVFVGGDVEIKLAVSAARPLSFSLAAEGADPGCLRLERVVEERWPSRAVAVSLLRLRYRAVAACDATVGPFRVDALSPVQSTVTSTTVTLRVDAPASFSPTLAPRWTATLPVPSLVAGDDDWAVGRSGPLVYALGRPDQAPRAGGVPPDFGLELRDIADEGGQSGTTVAAGGAWLVAGPVTVQVDGRDYPVP